MPEEHHKVTMPEWAVGNSRFEVDLSSMGIDLKIQFDIKVKNKL